MDPNTNQPLPPVNPGQYPQPPLAPQPGQQPAAPPLPPLPPQPPQPAVLPPQQYQPDTIPRAGTLGNNGTPAALPQSPPTPDYPNMPADRPSQPPTWSEALASRTTPPLAPAQPIAPMPPVMPSAPPRNSRRMAAVIIAVVLVVLLAAGAAYFMFGRKSTNTGADKAASKSSSAVAATGLAQFSKVTLAPPSAIDGYTAHDTGTASIKDYVSTDNTCEFIVGTVSAAQLPGDNLDAIIQPQLKQLRDAGATITGPSTGAALALHSATGSKTYSMPTITFQFQQGTKHAAVHYSAVILKSGDRAVVNRTCVNAAGDVDTARLQALDQIAQQITVTVSQ